MIFQFFKKIGFWGILGPPYCGIGATIRIGREILCLPYAGFFGIGATIRIGQEMLCLLYAGFLYLDKRFS